MSMITGDYTAGIHASHRLGGEGFCLNCGAAVRGGGLAMGNLSMPCAVPSPWHMVNDAGVSPDERAPELTAEGVRATEGAWRTHRPSTVATFAEVETLTENLSRIYCESSGESDVAAMRCVAREVLRRFPVPVVLSTAGDQSTADEVTALRKALADAEERSACWEKRDGVERACLLSARKKLADVTAAQINDAATDARVYRDIAHLCGANLGVEGVVAAVRRVVSERDEWRERAQNEGAMQRECDRLARQLSRVRDAVAAHVGEGAVEAVHRYIIDANAAADHAKKERDEAVAGAVFAFKQEAEQHKLVQQAVKERDEAVATLTAVRKALGGGLS